MKSLVWFRNDLRLDDNPALREAFINSNEIHAVYIYSPEQLNLHNEANCKVEFIIKNLHQLNQSLDDLNIPLTIIRSKGFDDNVIKISELIIERSITNVYWNKTFGIDELRRDLLVENYLSKNDIFFKCFDDQVVFSPGTIKTNEEKPYSVFTPFKRKWIENFKMDFLDIDFKYTKKNNPGIQSNINQFDFEFVKSHSVDMSIWKIGEKDALSILHDYLEKKIYKYAKDRNDPIINGTSRLSPYLASGVISPKNVF